MTCAELHEILPELQEGERNAALEAHLESCPECSGLVADLESISRQSRLLGPSEEPSPRVWQAIEKQLRQEGLIRDSQPERPFLVTTPRRRWWSATWLVPVAAVLAVGGALWLSRPASFPVADNRTSATRPGTTLHDDIDDDKAVLAEVQKNAPMMEATYEVNLQNVNAYIEDAQRSVNDNPGDDDAREYLLEAKEQKSMLYEMALDRSLP